MDDPLKALKDLFGTDDKPHPKRVQVEKGVKMTAKTIDGERWVRLSDVCDLLKVNGVLPGTEKKFRRSV